MTGSRGMIECPVHRHARRNPGETALRDDALSLTYGELERRIAERAGWARSSGVRRGDRVAILAENSIHYAIWIYTLYRVGATSLPLNLRRSAEWWKRSVDLAECRRLIADEARWDAAMKLTRPGRPLHLVPEKNGLAPETFPDPKEGFHEIREDLEATIIFTSGSTGEPRGVVLTLGNHLSSAAAANANLPLTRGDCWLAVLPFYHVGGMAILFRSALAGSAVYVHGTFDPVRINARIDGGEITHISLVPTMLERLIDARGTRSFPRGLKAILLGGGPVPGRLIETIRERSLPVLTTYGMTEAASQVAALSPLDPKSSLPTAGRPLSHCEVDIVDANGATVEAGKTGEIRVRGKGIFQGYLGAGKWAAVDPDGWFRTGDIGRLDKDGYLHVIGRIDDMFISGGENIYPWEIESRAMEVPGVVECAVVPAEDRKWGHRPVLFVAVRDENYPGRDAMGLHLEGSLPPIMVPDRIIEIGEFPRTALGKIDKAALCRLANQECGNSPPKNPESPQKRHRLNGV